MLLERYKFCGLLLRGVQAAGQGAASALLFVASPRWIRRLLLSCQLSGCIVCRAAAHCLLGVQTARSLLQTFLPTARCRLQVHTTTRSDHRRHEQGSHRTAGVGSHSIHS